MPNYGSHHVIFGRLGDRSDRIASTGPNRCLAVATGLRQGIPLYGSGVAVGVFSSPPTYRNTSFASNADSSLCRDTPTLAKTRLRTVRAVPSAIPNLSAASFGGKPAPTSCRNSGLAKGHAEQIAHDGRIGGLVELLFYDERDRTRVRQELLREKRLKNRQHVEREPAIGNGELDEDRFPIRHQVGRLATYRVRDGFIKFLRLC